MLNRVQRAVMPVLRKRIVVHRPELLPHDRPFIMAANHQSYLDPIAAWFAVAEHCNRQTFFITKHPLKKWFGRLGQSFGMMYINPADKPAVLLTAATHLAQGTCICIFPEGARNKVANGQILKAKTGTARLALTLGVPVVPAGIVSPSGRAVIEAVNNFFSSAAEYSVTIGKPLAFSQVDQSRLSYDLLTKTMRQVMRCVGELCHKEYPY